MDPCLPGYLFPFFLLTSSNLVLLQLLLPIIGFLCTFLRPKHFIHAHDLSFFYLMKFCHGRSFNIKLYLLCFRKEIYQISPINGKANLLQSIQDIVLNRIHRITLPSDSRMKPKFHILYDSYLDSRTNSPQYFLLAIEILNILYELLNS